MRPVYCAAVDLGATSGRVIVGEWSGHRLRLREAVRFPNQFRSLGGHQYWDIPGLWNEVQKGLLKAKGMYPRLASVGVDGWAVDHVLVNREGRPVFPVHAYRDTRTARASAQLGRRGMKRVYALTGIPNYPYNTSLQLQESLASFPMLATAVSRCLFIPDYFNFLLSGRMVNELSIASHSQLLDVGGMDWSAGALAHFGVPRSWFGRPARSPRRLGPVSGVAGLGGVLSVLVPGHDTACAFAAMPAAPGGADLYVSTGTWSLMGFESDKPLLGRAALEARVSNERMGDGRYRPLRSSLGLWLLEKILPEFGSRPAKAAEWVQLIDAAANAPATAERLHLDDPSLFNPTSMRAAIDAQLLKAGARGPRNLAEYARLIFDSLGTSHAGAARVFEALRHDRFQRILIVGGGAKNRLICQATANASDRMVVAHSLEGAAVGNIAAQLVALGAVEDHAAFRAALSRQLKGVEYSPQASPRAARKPA